VKLGVKKTEDEYEYDDEEDDKIPAVYNTSYP
jgi:hypothetical protein